MREVERGVWHWDAPHPDWAGPENEAFRQRLATADTLNGAARGLVSSLAIDDCDRLLLFDPLAVPREMRSSLPVQVVLATHGGPADSAALGCALA
jgi:hypothetical protein